MRFAVDTVTPLSAMLREIAGVLNNHGKSLSPAAGP
ncbi:hypothetical protein J2046_003813 [Rhizobium petrolearium]|nr:hypothetical protein [Neorhizobium petrolearium]